MTCEQSGGLRRCDGAGASERNTKNFALRLSSRAPFAEGDCAALCSVSEDRLCFVCMFVPFFVWVAYPYAVSIVSC